MLTRRHAARLHVALLVTLSCILGAPVLEGQARTHSTPSRAEVRAAATNTTALRVVISVNARRLWIVGETGDTLRSAPVAVGSGRSLRGSGQVWKFDTPRGEWHVLSKETNPVWIRPDWAYVEVARDHRFRLDSVSEHRPRPLGEGRTLVVRGNVVGVLSDSSTFEPWPVDDEIVFDRVLYMPPIGTVNRAIPRTLGEYRLNLGNGIGIHGTQERESIGHAVTHGCLRLSDSDLAWVFANVPVGTPVFIY
jgi:lipoprotein-anchoring transpeptidase ErfK/SrfK